jgi:hypothetical protein
VISAFNTPLRRITFAATISVLLHVAILWLPYVQLPHAKVEVPPLTVSLENLTEPVSKVSKLPEQPEQVTPLANAVKRSSIKPLNSTISTMNKSEETSPRTFPKHLMLTFIVYKDEDSSRIGEIRHQLDIHGNRYSLKSDQRSSGLNSLRNNDRIILSSHGKIGDYGLQPDTFEEEDIDESGKQSMQAIFDWAEKKLRFSDGNETALPENAQDVLSFMYQLSQIALTGEYFPMPISDGSQLQQVQIEIGIKEDLSTPMGKIRALHLRKIHSDREAYFEIWLGLEYRLLPVKFRQVDSLGNTIEEFVVSDIRSSDE